ncbi:MAG: hypothetical protein JSW00_04010 [Thermoplasmata archaeon]|nr:MAG: hypothetical protein JSW00_04010 [Thermoplasmata archaeon]
MFTPWYSNCKKEEEKLRGDVLLMRAAFRCRHLPRLFKPKEKEMKPMDPNNIGKELVKNKGLLR